MFLYFSGLDIDGDGAVGASAYLGHVRLRMGDKGIMVSDVLSKKYVISFDQRMLVRNSAMLFTGAGLADANVRMFKIYDQAVEETDALKGIERIKVAKTFSGHSQTVTSLTVHQNSETGKLCLYSSSWDGTYRVWDYSGEAKCLVTQQFADEHLLDLKLVQIRTTQWLVIACRDRCVRMIRVKDVLPQSLRARIGSFMDSPEAVSITLFIIIVDLLSGTVTDFGIPEKDKDCFGRDSLASFYVSATVCSLFLLDLLARVYIQQGTYIYYTHR
jgi:WD40 repeat protein